MDLGLLHPHRCPHSCSHRNAHGVANFRTNDAANSGAYRSANRSTHVGSDEYTHPTNSFSHDSVSNSVPSSHPRPTQIEGSKDQQEDGGWAWWIWLLIAVAGLLGAVCLMVLVVGCLMCCGGSGEQARVTPEPAPESVNTDRVVHNDIYERDGLAETSI